MAAHLTRRFSIRFPPEELAQMRETARKVGMPVSTLLRTVCLAAELPTPPRQIDRAVIRRLRRVGNRLNDIARWANTHHHIRSERELSEVLAEVRECLEEIP